MNFNAVFLGYTFYLVFSLIARKSENRHILNITITYTVRTLSYIYLVFLFISIYNLYISDSNALINRMTGPYWFAFWLYPVIYFLLPQLFWFRKIQDHWLFKSILAILFLLSFLLEDLIIGLTMIYRDYMPSSWSTDYHKNLNYVVEIIAGIAIFGFLTFILNSIRLLQTKKFN